MKKTLIISGSICIVIGVGLLVALLALSWGSGPALSGMMGDIDRHFMEQMIPHHDDAVAMAELALAKAEHPELRGLAETIIRDQTREIDQMETWYRDWYGVDAPTDAGAFGGRGSGGGMMGGGMMGGGMMGDQADLGVLEAAAVFDKEFIEQMIPHHQMGVMMAQMVLARSDRPEIQELARSIIKTQTAEIEQMQDWYQEWYGR
jgi:uncharacterized protein (DUF305 family)